MRARRCCAGDRAIRARLRSSKRRPGGVDVVSESGRLAGAADRGDRSGRGAARCATGDRDGFAWVERSVFTEVLLPPPHLLVCGAGDDAMPLVARAAAVGFRVTVVDHRAGLPAPRRASRTRAALLLAAAGDASAELPSARVDLRGGDDPLASATTASGLRRLLATRRALRRPARPARPHAADPGARSAPRPRARLRPGGSRPRRRRAAQVAISIVAELLAVWRRARAAPPARAAEAIHVLSAERAARRRRRARRRHRRTAWARQQAAARARRRDAAAAGRAAAPSPPASTPCSWCSATRPSASRAELRRPALPDGPQPRLRAGHRHLAARRPRARCRRRPTRRWSMLADMPFVTAAMIARAGRSATATRGAPLVISRLRWRQRAADALRPRAVRRASRDARTSAAASRWSSATATRPSSSPLARGGARRLRRRRRTTSAVRAPARRRGAEPMRARPPGARCRLARRGEPFVLATVVAAPAARARRKCGDMAVVTPRRRLPRLARRQLHAAHRASRGAPGARGRHAAAAWRSTPDPRGRAAARRSTVFPMTCHSGGSVEIYIEPVLPAPRLVVFGVSPVARALARLGKAMGYAVYAVDPAADASAFPGADAVATSPRSCAARARPPVFAVVATHGRWDEDAIAGRARARARPTSASWRAPSASREMRSLLAGKAPEEALAAHPAARPASTSARRTPEEIALSILAEIVQLRRAAAPPPVASRRRAPPPSRRIDPVCGMTVDAWPARATAPQHGGRTSTSAAPAAASASWRARSATCRRGRA